MGNIHNLRCMHLNNNEVVEWERACLRQERYL